MQEPTKVVETHISNLFFVGDHVYKLRKPVKFGFVDFRNREDRRADCEREVSLNRRLAPDVYMGVADVVIDGAPIDHMVVMRRMPDDRRLARLAGEGAVLVDWLRQVAEKLAEFHSKAARSADIDSVATAESLRVGWQENFAETEPFMGSPLDVGLETDIRALALRWIAGRARLLASRIDSGRVCDGHGDLQAEDIFCLDDGVRILDCMEFSDRLRYCDVCADVAFLAMDLERLRRPDDAGEFLRAYEEATREELPASLVHHYCASRAYVRAKVACIRFAQGANEVAAQARQLQELTLAHLMKARVILVMVGGPPGSGKSTVAAGIAEARHLALLRSDEIRIELGLEGGRPGYRMGNYAPAETARVYTEMLEKARRLLELGESVILDASWVDAEWRAAASEMASVTSSEVFELRCVVDPREASTRIAERLRHHSDISEATPEVSESMRRSMDAWDSATVIDTSGKDPQESISAALGALGR